MILLISVYNTRVFRKSIRYIAGKKLLQLKSGLSCPLNVFEPILQSKLLDSVIKSCFTKGNEIINRIGLYKFNFVQQLVNQIKSRANKQNLTFN